MKTKIIEITGNQDWEDLVDILVKATKKAESHKSSFQDPVTEELVTKLESIYKSEYSDLLEEIIKEL